MFPDQELYPFRENGKWGYINQNGKMVVKSQYEAAGVFVGDYAAVVLDTNILNSQFRDGSPWNSSHWCVINGSPA